MMHEAAREQHAVERYLLGELRGEARDDFEEHLFECEQCAGDVKAGVLLLDTAQRQFTVEREAVDAPAQKVTPRPVPPNVPSARVVAISSPRRRLWLPAIAAGLLITVGYQGLVQVPGLRRQLARAQAPVAMQELVLAGAGARGWAAPVQVHLPASGTLLLSVDIPGAATYQKYLCSLVSPGGKLLWQLQIAPDTVKDAVPIRVPAGQLYEGENRLRIQGVPLSSAGGNAPPIDLATYRFHVTLER